jgi:hypothetical protein
VAQKSRWRRRALGYLQEVLTYRSMEARMELEYTLIDCSTGLIYGPYESFREARERAQDFTHWEIMNREGNLIEWITPSTIATATEQAA